jgi:hypothetical protein
MKANITLKVDSEFLRQARLVAAEEGVSVTALLAAQPMKMLREHKVYSRAKKTRLSSIAKRF